MLLGEAAKPGEDGALGMSVQAGTIEVHDDEAESPRSGELFGSPRRSPGILRTDHGQARKIHAAFGYVGGKKRASPDQDPGHGLGGLLGLEHEAESRGQTRRGSRARKLAKTPLELRKPPAAARL